MIQSASSQADPSEIRKLYGVEFAVFSDDPHRCHMRIVFDDISLLAFVERHTPPFLVDPGRLFGVWNAMKGILLIPSRMITELMFGSDTLIIIRNGEESRGNTNASSCWPFFWPAKDPECARALKICSACRI